MATINLVNNPSGTGSFAGASVPRKTLLPPTSPRFIRARSKQEANEIIKHGDDQEEEVADGTKDEATSTANQVNQKAKGSGAAQGTLGAKAKQVWETAIETAQKAKETVLGKAGDHSKDAIKKNADK